METKNNHIHDPKFWLPPLYFAEGLPAAVITEVSLLLFQFFGMSNSAIAFWTNFLGLVPLIFVKIFCAPLVDMLSTRRRWIINGQFILACLFFAVSLVCFTATPIPLLITLFFCASLVSGIHDIAADGFYIIALNDHEQALYSGLRSVFFRVAMVVGSGVFVVFAGLLVKYDIVPERYAWIISMFTAALMLGGIAFYCRIMLPCAAGDIPGNEMAGKQLFADFVQSFLTFFRKEHVLEVLLFLLLYRLGEAQLLVMSKLFLLGEDGLHLPKDQYGMMVGVAGVLMMLAGGVLAGFLAARYGLKKMLLPMAIAINAPDVLYLLLAFLSAPPVWFTGSCVAVEQFGYGFGFTGFMLFMVWFASTGSDHFKTGHFALMTVFMIIGIRLPGMPSGWIAEKLAEQAFFGWTEYQLFFLWVLICTIPGFLVTARVKGIVPADYGRKKRDV